MLIYYTPYTIYASKNLFKKRPPVILLTEGCLPPSSKEFSKIIMNEED